MTRSTWPSETAEQVNYPVSVSYAGRVVTYTNGAIANDTINYVIYGSEAG